jgi:hypothetical protein
MLKVHLVPGDRLSNEGDLSMNKNRRSDLTLQNQTVTLSLYSSHNIVGGDEDDSCLDS